ncbi:MAG: CotH kinase family protein [Pseudomonadota bacterium]|nr:CotH kinase family protein [Pseudomonadota bacterium]
MQLILLSLLGCGPTDGSKPADSDGSTGGDTGADSADDTDLTGDPDLMCQVVVECDGNILDDPKVPCVMQVVSGDGVPLYDGPAGMELRGRTSLTFPKPQYSAELRDHTELPIWPGFVWHYIDDGSDLGTSWRDLSYDDAAWSEGAAPLGYGGDYLATIISSGPDSETPAVTSYFRYTFGVASLPDITKLSVGLLRNDGAAVYLNGTEILRENLASGASFDTRAVAPVSAADELLWVVAKVDPSLLVDGMNVIAVELHQAEPGGAIDESPGDTGDTGDTADVVDLLGDARFDLFLEASGGDAPTDLLGMGSDSDWILNGQYLDRVLFRNRLAFDLFQSFGGPERYATESVFCELTLGGQYQGVYTLGEKIEREDTRVDIGDEGSPGTSFIVKLDDVDGFHENAVGYGTWQLVFPDDTAAAQAEVSSYLTAWEDAIQGADPSDPVTGIFGYVDLASAVDFVLLQEFTKNIDAYQLSVHLWKDTAGKMFFSPWDLDLSFGYPFYDCGAEGWITRTEFVDAMAAEPAFHAALVARWAELREGPMGEDAILARIAGYDATLGEGVARNFERWPIEDIAYQTDEVDDWLCPVSSHEEEHARVLTFISARLVWMDANIDAF